ncbi:hypothetical protein AQUCO_01300881v1 [Aquilegia coerulea]|uniref:Uncharacterized protein n=1 Tax=Aquilegia coerulea TaxID=218851 RepID=A0A2G5E3S4_AQUCA|nr:hypothetical protein AQUCO_01300881v1 [Aquilegia coerulea]
MIAHGAHGKLVLLVLLTKGLEGHNLPQKIQNTCRVFCSFVVFGLSEGSDFSLVVLYHILECFGIESWNQKLLFC